MFEIIEKILILFYAGLLGLVCALFSYFLDYCFWNKSIFKKWLPFLADYLVKKNDPERYKKILLETSHYVKEHEQSAIDDRIVLMQDAAENYALYKIFGGCAICSNVYIASVSFYSIYFLTDLFSFWHLLPYALVSSAYLRKLTKVTY